MKKKVFLILFVLFFTKLFSLERTLYVDNFNSILGSPSNEDKLLKFASKNNFNTLILYQLNKVDKLYSLTDPRKNNILAEFISKAKTKFNIKRIGASGESATFFKNRIDIYNTSRNKSEEKFDIYNLEYEYWSKNASGIDGYYCVNYLEENKLPCTRKGSFKYFIDNLKDLKLLTKNKKHSVKVDAYVGYYTQNEILEISKNCDRLVIQAHGKSPELSFSFAKKNLENLYKTNSKIKASIIFSTNMDKLGYWLKFDSLDNGESKFFDKMNSINANLKKKLNFDGFSYHSYSILERSVNYYTYSKN
ncbi:hypothetical protein SAMN05216503_2034 [Polaribacter sp. KT25b]|uniref:hypothetical protein n=1 Tax=Polaribacter sp. KT25b TaxID=1855336 RepID=UPI00087D2EEE|nr:hypothetical protein [Polaribacter sp. KT25b]SDS11983.1 hypothetical protein SAMN05216503_2034 [Polaribacter sp. KT25b]